MKLYYAPNTISVAAAIGLEEAGLAYEPVLVDFASAEQTKAPYLDLNPKGRVPALTVDTATLTETGAILEFIADQAPGAGLVPADPLEAAHMRSVMYYLASTMHVNHAHMRRGNRWADLQTSWDDMAAKVPQTMTASAAYVEENALRGPFVLGDQISIADPYLYVICAWLPRDGVDTSAFPKISAFLEAMAERPSVRAVTRIDML